MEQIIIQHYYNQRYSILEETMHVSFYTEYFLCLPDPFIPACENYIAQNQNNFSRIRWERWESKRVNFHLPCTNWLTNAHLYIHHNLLFEDNIKVESWVFCYVCDNVNWTLSGCDKSVHSYCMSIFLFPANFLSASYIVHSTAFQTPQGVTWSGGQLIYAD